MSPKIEGLGNTAGLKLARNLGTGPIPEPGADKAPEAAPTKDVADLKMAASIGSVGTSLTDLVAKAKQAASEQPAAEPKKEEHHGFFGSLWSGIKHEASHLVDEVEHGAETIWDHTGKPVVDEVKKIPSQVSDLYVHVVDGTSKDQFKTRQIDYNPSDVNAPGWDEEAEATRELEANHAAEQRELDNLSPEDRQKYQAIASQVSDKPMAQRELQKMLLDGRLPGAKDLAGQGTLLDQLHTLATEKLADGIDRTQLLNDTIGEVENPVRTNQHGKSSCGATTAQILLERKHPAEYVRLLTGLASPEGEAKMAGGHILKRVPDWQADDGGRSMSSRLFQPAVMDEAAKDTFWGDRYSNTQDKNKEVGIGLGGGMTDGASASINTQLEGVHFEKASFHRWNRDSHWNELKQALTDGKGPIPVSMQFNDDGTPGGHFVQIDKIEKGKVYYTNPWGQQETMDEDEFKAHTTGMEIPDHPIK